MTIRIDCFSAAPQVMDILVKQENYFRQQFNESDTLTMCLWELVKIRVSQLNKCAYCIDMHNKDALKQGETPQRLYGLTAWNDMPFYSEIEKAALQWCELVTSGEAVTELDYQQAIQVFGVQGLVDLTLAVNAINSWNRLSKAFTPEVGSYRAI